MRGIYSTKPAAKSPRAVDAPPNRAGRLGWAVLVAVLIACSAVFAVRVHDRGSAGPIRATTITAAAPLQGVSQFQSRRDGRLSLQPEADRMRRIIGHRFLTTGNEVGLYAGTLTVGADQQAVRILRTQNEEGEMVEIARSGDPTSLTWSGRNGAQVDGRVAVGKERSLIERIALASPDEFILSQLRGASYYSVARSVRPESAGGSSDYAGPTWNVVRITEQASYNWRLYFINTVTGLLDKVVSEDDGAEIIADMSEWVEQDGEKAPTHITWRADKQVVMELRLDNISLGPR